MDRSIWLTLLAATTFLLPACSRSRAQVEVGYAAPVADWSGFNNIKRDGSVYFAGQPTADALREAPKRGVTTVVNLRPGAEMAERVDFDEPALVEELGMEYVSIPVEGASISAREADQLASVLKSRKGDVLIHCGSANRVGGLWALYLERHQGLSRDESLARGRQAGLRSDRLEQRVRQEMDEE